MYREHEDYTRWRRGLYKQARRRCQPPMETLVTVVVHPILHQVEHLTLDIQDGVSAYRISFEDEGMSITLTALPAESVVLYGYDTPRTPEADAILRELLPRVLREMQAAAAAS